MDHPSEVTGLHWLKLFANGLVGGLILYFTVKGIYDRHFHPLSAYPGPFLWTLYRWPFAVSLIKGSLAHDLKHHHDTYGKIVRVAPNELSLIEAQAWQDIYGYHRGGLEFEKNRIWAQPAPNGVRSILSANQADHTRMRRLLSPAFSVKALREANQLATVHVDTLIQRLHAQCNKKAAVLNFKDYYIWTTFDIIGDLGFGESFDCLKYERYHGWVSFLFSHLKAGILNACINFYPPVGKLVFWLTPKTVFQQAIAHHEMSVDKVDRRLSKGTKRKDLISYVLKAKDEKGMLRLELDSTAAALILAGAEGVSSSLTATTNHLLRHPGKLQKLAHEIRSTFKEEAEMTAPSLESLPYLKAVILEGFRFTAPVPIGIPRIVPPEDAIVAGQVLPGNTFVSVPQFAAYRSASNFALANAYIPERWLPEGCPIFAPTPEDPPFSRETFANDNRKVLQPFSVGPRDCIGKGLALMEVRQILARLLWNFDLDLPSQGYRFVPFEQQKTFALWERQPMHVRVTKREF